MTVSHAFTLGTPSNVPKPGSVLVKTRMDGNKSNILSFLGTIAAAATILTTVPFSANAADISQGKVVFEQSCAGCHKGGGNAMAKEKTLTQDAIQNFLGYDGETASETDISRFVKDSNVHRGALAFSARLTDADYANVAAYIYDQAMLDKW